MQGKLIVLAAVILVGIAYGWPTKNGEVTVYWIRCLGEIVKNPSRPAECKGKWVAMSRSIYYVSAERQQVIYQSLGELRSFGRCIVIDTKNWQCDYQDDSGRVAMIDGQYQYTPNLKKWPNITLDENGLYVSWWQFWITHIRGMF